MPEIAELCGGFEITGKVDARPIDLTVSQNYRREGVVLIGDAFCTTCPVPGVGIQRAMTDVEQLCSVYIPGWLKTEGMHLQKISEYYGDATKNTNDFKGMSSSHYARNLAVNEKLVWSMRRWRNAFLRRVLLRTAARPSDRKGSQLQENPNTGLPAPL